MLYHNEYPRDLFPLSILSPQIPPTTPYALPSPFTSKSGEQDFRFLPSRSNPSPSPLSHTTLSLNLSTMALSSRFSRSITRTVCRSSCLSRVSAMLSSKATWRFARAVWRSVRMSVLGWAVGGPWVCDRPDGPDREVRWVCVWELV